MLTKKKEKIWNKAKRTKSEWNDLKCREKNQSLPDLSSLKLQTRFHSLIIFFFSWSYTSFNLLTEIAGKQTVFSVPV